MRYLHTTRLTLTALPVFFAAAASLTGAAHAAPLGDSTQVSPGSPPHPADADDPRTSITTQDQRDVVDSFSRVMHDYETGDTGALNNDLTLQALDNFHQAPPEMFSLSSQADVASRGPATLHNARVWISPNNNYAWLRTGINYAHGGTNTVIVMMVHDFGSHWKLASVELT